jgi:predicted nucleic acid-binding Zn ribbon protein
VIALRDFAAAAVAQAIRPGPLCQEKVALAWKLAVGPALARTTEARLDAHGVLHVTTADTHWSREVRRSAGLIRARLERMLGSEAITQLNVRP